MTIFKKIWNGLLTAFAWVTQDSERIYVNKAKERGKFLSRIFWQW